MDANARCRVAYVSFQSLAPQPLSIAGKLSLPAGGPLTGAAVVICHGSDGVDGRGEFYAPALHARGVATLEIDMWAARGTVRGALARPASPVETLPDAFGALAFLAAQPEIDPARIGILGFSWGGVVSLLASTLRRQPDGGATRFAAHAANYPVCWAFQRLPAFNLAQRTGAPILIQTGEADAYDTPGAGERLVQSMGGGAAAVTGIAYTGATHGFDRDLPAQTIIDPFAHDGAGGPVLMQFDPAAAAAAQQATAAFFEKALAPAPL